MDLSLIKNTVQKVAEAITAALDIETEIVDKNLKIIGGTGRYINKIGLFEEDGDLNSIYIYSRLLKTGAEYICIDPNNDPLYNPQEGELGEISCPILLNNKVIGLIGLVAFSEVQREKITKKEQNFSQFLRIMANLIASKLAMAAINDSMKITLDSMLSPMAVSTSFLNIIGDGKAINKIKDRALQVSTSDSTVLITGESGTGKELFARSIHHASTRKDQAFVSINCGAIPEMLIESELFGYEKGAFTGADRSGKLGKFEIADHGTIFLDEIGDLPIHLQVKLLSVIQNRQVDRIGGVIPINIDVRIIAATNKDLEAMIKTKAFREDLFFRLNVIPLHIPPLRERPEDLVMLMDFALHKFSDRLGKSLSGFSQEAKDVLIKYPWPGNVRELENAVEYAVNMESKDMISLFNLPDKIVQHSITEDYNSGSLKERLRIQQKYIIMDILDRTGQTLEGKRAAAKILDISESTLYRMLREREDKIIPNVD
jgi:transcriptional regulator with PAS, ATPase and Fis domain